MDLEKLPFTTTDEFPYTTSSSSIRRKLVSGLSLGLVISLLVLTVILFNFSFNAPFLNPVFQGFNSLNSNSTSLNINWPFPFQPTPNNITANHTALNANFINFTAYDAPPPVMSPVTRVDNLSAKNVTVSGEGVNGTVSRNDSRDVVVVVEKGGSLEKCDIFDGRWVRDDTKPYYPAGSCPYIDRDFDCYLNKRQDDGFVKWRWQPNGCDIPRYD